jgi:hypothetical protein
MLRESGLVRTYGVNMELKIKKPWHKPKVADYGHVSQLTAGTTGSHTDKGHLSNQHGGG